MPLQTSRTRAVAGVTSRQVATIAIARVHMAVSQVGTLVSRQSIPPFAETSHDWSGASGPTCRERRARNDAMTDGCLDRPPLSAPCGAGNDGLTDTSGPGNTPARCL